MLCHQRANLTATSILSAAAQAIQQMLASLGGMGVAKKSRALPYDELCAALSRIAGDKVARDNLHATLVSLFGEDASVVSIVSQGLKMLKEQLDAHLPGAVQFVRGNLEGGQKNVAYIQETIQREGWQQFITVSGLQRLSLDVGPA